jgi:2-polyprenyl-3-methyl-5-hydroxy-6-metoxy-1,4-benzoquinol methylase
VRADYGARYRELYQQHWWWRARESIILDVLRQHQPPHGWNRILDVGCGDGLFFDQLLRFGDVEGVESDETLVSQSGPHRSRIHIGRFEEDLQLKTDFSLVLMLDVLEHLPDPASAIRYALHLLTSGGTLLITVPAFRFLWTNHDVLNQHVTRFTKRSFRNVAAKAGLEIEFEQYFFYWLFAAKTLERVVETMLRLPVKPPSVPAPPVNTTFYWLSRLENKTLGRLVLPFGSSLMVLGHKRSSCEESRSSAKECS